MYKNIVTKVMRPNHALKDVTKNTTATRMSAIVGSIEKMILFSRLLMLSVPRSMTRNTSPLFRCRCHRKDNPCRCLNSSSSISLVVYWEIRIQRKDLRLFSRPIPPVPPPCRNLNNTYSKIQSHLNSNLSVLTSVIDRLSTIIKGKRYS